ncbi:MAG: hypothetical protein K6F68_01770 [Clostridiales bacterium]|nr:hypothetical protein [Clostridiales bacterium]
MIRSSKRFFAAVFALLFVFVTLPAMNVFAAEYDQHDVEKLRSFFELVSFFGDKNGKSINGNGYSPDDPSTWSKSCTWDETTGKLKKFSMTNHGSWVTGVLDLEGFTGLTTVVVQDCYIDGIVLTGCAALSYLDLSGDNLEEVSVADCTELESLLVRENKFTSIDLANNTKLKVIDVFENKLTSLDLSVCTELTKLNCQRNQLTELDLSHNLKLKELEIRTNLLTSVDISMLTELKVFNSRANRLTSVDLSVLNGGESFILDTQPGGYIGTYFSWVGVDTYSPCVSYAAIEGYTFLGWYSDGELLSTENHFPVTFGEGAKHITAHFMMLGDLDRSGDVTAADALLLLRYAMGIITADEIDINAANVNGDDTIDAADALIVLRYAMGIITGF